MEAVVFDVDGVLTDSEPLHLEAANRILGPLGCQLSESENTAYLGLDEKTFWAQVMRRFALKGDWEKLAADRQNVVVALIREGIVPMPGVPEFITGLHMRGFPLACASSSPRKVVEAVLEELGLVRSFQAVVCGDEVAEGKPHPAIFLEAARLLGVLPEECLAVEDSPKGIAASRGAGMFTVAVRNRYNVDLDLSGADRIFSGLDRFDWSIFEVR